jgi:hypothetical protein
MVRTEDRKWGSLIAARPELGLKSTEDNLEDEPWLNAAYNYLVIGEITLPDGEPAVTASVHSPAKPVSDFLEWQEVPDLLSPAEIESLVRVPGSGVAPYANDFIFAAVERATRDRRLLCGGDWNTTRFFDNFPEYGPPVCAAFFHPTRVARRGASGYDDDHGRVTAHGGSGHEQVPGANQSLSPVAPGGSS